MTEDDGAAGEAAAAVPKPRTVPVNRKRVVSQLWRAAKRQLDAHEEHLSDMPKGAAASEADAKALATLARTVRELVAIDEPAPGRKDKQTDDLSAADGLRHVAELRKELARRLEVLAAREAGAAAPAIAADGDA
ncbi:hypothetical protein [Bosea sp. (in: a-proteobacteria)]|uniref:hypothetical protein n=1 Tax=Bosea sp. (in: a-proteobacteria) TaxID=1871050 RepID=UPI0012007DCC|nr:hypothetical protein [Bosea sp. (in: a-proteobacteria)]TAJ34230.1 MAG: hypothetical protein EPO59_02255 [Bosea sp. (in: a-proteobacteria)]